MAKFKAIFLVKSEGGGTGFSSIEWLFLKAEFSMDGLGTGCLLVSVYSVQWTASGCCYCCNLHPKWPVHQAIQYHWILDGLYRKYYTWRLIDVPSPRS